MVESHLCTASEIARALGVSARSVQLNAKALRDKASGLVFPPDGNSWKML